MDAATVDTVTRQHTTTQVIVADWVVPVVGEPVRHGAVAVVGDRIVAIGDAAEVLHDAREAQGAGGEVLETERQGILTPGLVNAHSHLQYTCMAEVGQGVYEGFEDWSHAFQDLYEQPHDWAASAADGLRIAISTGTTAISDIVTDAEALRVLEDGRVHGIAYWELMSWLTDEWSARGRSETEALLEQAQSRWLGLSPHAPYSLDTDVIRDLGKLAHERGVRRHMHLAESAWEAEYTQNGTGALADQWRDWGFADFQLLRRGGSKLRPVPYAESIGALGPTSHVAHGIYTDAADREILRRTGTVVALCPRSNAVIGLDEAPVADYLREGNAIAVGTDSLSSTPSLDLSGDVAALAAIARRQGYNGDDLHRRLFAAATLGGAVAMGLDTGSHRLGALQPGALADFAVFDHEATTARDVLASLVEGGDGHVTTTIIAGDVRWEAGR
ncbi:amidohydrolase family protein [Plantibacter sp. Mn2098]|uniref:amidohydrolase family protein n=1 Tax=Plantibacter sp. Mn2098 TaxID=3395266 RepID=UPI003BE1E784